MEDLNDLNRIGKQSRQYERQNREEAKVVLQQYGKNKVKLSVVEPAEDEALHDLLTLSHHQEDEEECENLNLISGDYHRAPKRPDAKLIHSGSKTRMEGQDWEEQVCFHDILGTPCNPQCVGRNCQCWQSKWKASRFLRNQTLDQGQLQQTRLRNIEGYMDKAERELRKIGLPIPDKGYRGKPRKDGQTGESGKAPFTAGEHRRPPSRAPPSRKEGLLKKHQYNPSVSVLDFDAMGDKEYQDILERALKDPRREQLFVIEWPEGEENPDEDLRRMFDPSV